MRIMMILINLHHDDDDDDEKKLYLLYIVSRKKEESKEITINNFPIVIWIVQMNNPYLWIFIDVYDPVTVSAFAPILKMRIITLVDFVCKIQITEINLTKVIETIIPIQNHTSLEFNCHMTPTSSNGHHICQISFWNTTFR